MFEVKIDEPIYIRNFDSIMDKMKEMDPKLAKKFRSELKRAVKPVQLKAHRYVPQEVFKGWRKTKPFYPTNWGWAYDTDHRGRTYGKTGESRWQWSQEQVVRGIVISYAETKVQRQGGKITTTALSLQNKSVPGIIYELAGFGKGSSKRRTRRVSRNKDASELFIDAVRKSDNQSNKPRLVYRAAYEMASSVHANLYGVLKKYLGENFRG